VRVLTCVWVRAQKTTIINWMRLCPNEISIFLTLGHKTRQIGAKFDFVQIGLDTPKIRETFPELFYTSRYSRITFIVIVTSCLTFELICILPSIEWNFETLGKLFEAGWVQVCRRFLGHTQFGCKYTYMGKCRKKLRRASRQCFVLYGTGLILSACVFWGQNYIMNVKPENPQAKHRTEIVSVFSALWLQHSCLKMVTLNPLIWFEFCDESCVRDAKILFVHNG
jgi:hypothetical protein